MKQETPLLEANSFGRAAPKIKTINVEANLLSQRISEQEKIREIAVRRLVGLCAALLVATTILPYMLRLDIAAGKVLASATEESARLSVIIDKATVLRQSVQPMLDQIALHETVRSHGKAFIGETTLALNAASPQLAFTSIHAEATSGEIHILVVSEAENYTAAREFVAAAGQGDDVKSAALVSMRRSDALGPNGVRFEFTKHIEVTQ